MVEDFFTIRTNLHMKIDRLNLAKARVRILEEKNPSWDQILESQRKRAEAIKQAKAAQPQPQQS